MAGFGTSSTWVKVGFVLLIVGTLVFTISFATASWVNYEGRYRSGHRTPERTGLWEYKLCDDCKALDVKRWGVIHLTWFRVCQVLACIGLICLFVSLIVLILYMCTNGCKTRGALIATIVLIFLAVFCIVVGIIVFATKFEKYGYKLAWSMGIAIAGVVLSFVAGIMTILELKGR